MPIIQIFTVAVHVLLLYTMTCRQLVCQISIIILLRYFFYPALTQIRTHTHTRRDFIIYFCFLLVGLIICSAKDIVRKQQNEVETEWTIAIRRVWKNGDFPCRSSIALLSHSTNVSARDDKIFPLDYLSAFIWLHLDQLLNIFHFCRELWQSYTPFI